MPPKDKVIEPINAEFDAVAKAVMHPITKKEISDKVLVQPNTQNPITSQNPQLELFIEKQVEIDGIGMGVLSDGTAFLTGRGLARLCGVNNARIVEMGQEWDLDENASPRPSPMTTRIKQILEERGIGIERPYVEIKQRSGAFHAYPDFVCLAALEYYAFDAPKEQAQKNFRLLAGKALHDFIYTQVGYDPNNFVPEVWRQFHDRVSLTYNSVPAGFFSIFREISDMIVTLGQAGIHIDSSFVPDISVGLSWGKHWTTNDLDKKYGQRQKWDHNFPDSFPQAQTNPQEVWCYPDEALAEFRRWMRETYIGEGKFINYVNSKVKQKELPPSFAQLAIAAYNQNDSN